MSIPSNFTDHWNLRKPRAWIQPSGNPYDVYRSLDNRVSDRSLPGGNGVIVANGFINPSGEEYFKESLGTMAQYGITNLIGHVWTGIKGYTAGITAQEYYTSAFYAALNNTIRKNLNTEIVPKVQSGEIVFDLYLGGIIPNQLNPTDWGVTGTISDVYPKQWHYFGQDSKVAPVVGENITADREWFVQSLSGSYASTIWFDAFGTTAELDLLQMTMGNYVAPLREYLPGGNPGDRYTFGGEGLPVTFLPGYYLGYPGGNKSIMDINRVGRVPFLSTLTNKRLFDPQQTWTVDYTKTVYHIIVQGSNGTGNETFAFPSIPTNEELQLYHDQGFCISCSLDVPSDTITFIMSLAEKDRQRLLDFYDYQARIEASIRLPGGTKTISGNLISKDGKLYTKELFDLLKNLKER